MKGRCAQFCEENSQYEDNKLDIARSTIRLPELHFLGIVCLN